jgi:DNA-binding transcriptional ArsR family regulator
LPDKQKVADVVLHPVRLRVLHAISGRQLTTAQLREALPDVAQATLYRHVAALVEAGFLAVVDERPVRGAVQRTYATGDRMAHVDQAELADMSDAQLRSAFLTLLTRVADSFDHLLAAGTAEERELLGFGTNQLYLDEHDLSSLQRGFAELIAPYVNETPGKRRMLLSTVVLPGNDPGQDT